MTVATANLLVLVATMIGDVISTKFAFDANPFAYEKGAVARLFGRQPEVWELACLKVAGTALPLSLGSTFWGFETSWVFCLPLAVMHGYFIHRNIEVAKR